MKIKFKILKQKCIHNKIDQKVPINILGFYIFRPYAKNEEITVLKVRRE